LAGWICSIDIVKYSSSYSPTGDISGCEYYSQKISIVHARVGKRLKNKNISSQGDEGQKRKDIGFLAVLHDKT
jgi:hypothetical protein